MKTTLSVAGVLMLAGSAFAQVTLEEVNIDRSSMLIEASQNVAVATQIGGPSPINVPFTQYSNLDPGPNGYAALSAPGVGGVTPVGFDDYSTASTQASFDLESFQFIGGVANAGGVLFFDFFDAGGNFVDGTGVQLPQGGNFQWTITISTPFEIPADGFMQMSADDGSILQATTGTWFLGDAGATVGFSDPLVGGGTDGVTNFDHNFSLFGTNIPTPGAAGLLALGGLAAARRRR